MRNQRRTVLIAAMILLAQPALAQKFLFGVKGGTPLSDSGLTRRVGTSRGIPTSGTATLNVRRYTVGPTVEFALPLRLRLGAEVLFKRIDQTDDREVGGRNFERTVSREKANSWEFPVIVSYGWDLGRVTPFGSGGGSVRWINSREGSAERFILVPTTQPPYQRSEFRVDDAIAEGGWITGGGVRFDVSVVKIAPEIRYTRWKTERFIPTRNQVEFLLGILF